jgi:hypothetical protein
VVTGLVFSLMQGIFHAYYTVALAPAIGAIIGMGAVLLWQRRRHPAVAATLAATAAVTAIWSYTLLGRSAGWHPWLRSLVLILGLAAAAGLLVAGRVRGGGRAAILAGAAAVAVSLAGPAAYAVDTASTPHQGAIPSAGPSTGFGGPGGGPGGGPRFAGRPGGPGGGPPAFGGRRFPVFPGGRAFPFPGGGTGRAPGGAGGPGGGLLNGSTPSGALTAALKQNAGSYRWVAATIGSNNASGYQLATGAPVMPIGGFNGTDPSPTLAQFQAYVAAGKIHYFIGGGNGFGGGFGGPRGRGGNGNGDQISSWVAANFPAQTVGGVTIYDLTQPTN